MPEFCRSGIQEIGTLMEKVFSPFVRCSDLGMGSRKAI